MIIPINFLSVLSGICVKLAIIALKFDKPYSKLPKVGWKIFRAQLTSQLVLQPIYTRSSVASSCLYNREKCLMSEFRGRRQNGMTVSLRIGFMAKDQISINNVVYSPFLPFPFSPSPTSTVNLGVGKVGRSRQ